MNNAFQSLKRAFSRSPPDDVQLKRPTRQDTTPKKHCGDDITIDNLYTPGRSVEYTQLTTLNTRSQSVPEISTPPQTDNQHTTTEQNHRTYKTAPRQLHMPTDVVDDVTTDFDGPAAGASSSPTATPPPSHPVEGQPLDREALMFFEGPPVSPSSSPSAIPPQSPPSIEKLQGELLQHIQHIVDQQQQQQHYQQQLQQQQHIQPDFPVHTAHPTQHGTWERPPETNNGPLQGGHLQQLQPIEGQQQQQLQHHRQQQQQLQHHRQQQQQHQQQQHHHHQQQQQQQQRQQLQHQQHQRQQQQQQQTDANERSFNLSFHGDAGSRPTSPSAIPPPTPAEMLTRPPTVSMESDQGDNPSPVSTDTLQPPVPDQMPPWLRYDYVTSPPDLPPWATAMLHTINNLRDKQRETDKLLEQLRSEVKCQFSEMRENRDKIVDLTDRSMRNNLVFSGIPEHPREDPEDLVQDVICNKLGLPEADLERVHRTGIRKHGKPRQIVAKCANFKMKETIRGKASRLRGTDIGVNEQYSKETNTKRHILTPLLKEARQKGQYATLIHDHLIIDNQKFKVDPDGHIFQDKTYSKPPPPKRYHPTPYNPTVHAKRDVQQRYQGHPAPRQTLPQANGRLNSAGKAAQIPAHFHQPQHEMNTRKTLLPNPVPTYQNTGNSVAWSHQHHQQQQQPQQHQLQQKQRHQLQQQQHPQNNTLSTQPHAVTYACIPPANQWIDPGHTYHQTTQSTAVRPDVTQRVHTQQPPANQWPEGGHTPLQSTQSSADRPDDTQWGTAQHQYLPPMNHTENGVTHLNQVTHTQQENEVVFTNNAQRIHRTDATGYPSTGGFPSDTSDRRYEQPGYMPQWQSHILPPPPQSMADYPNLGVPNTSQGGLFREE